MKATVSEKPKEPENKPASGLLPFEEASRLLESYKIRMVESRVAKPDAAAVQAAAREIGGPVALKLLSKDVVHKSDGGFVRLNLQAEKEIAEAVAGMLTAAEKKRVVIEGILVQKMAQKGEELLIGGKQDPQFGPVVVFGKGGVQAELWKDFSMRICSVSPGDPIGIKMDERMAKLLMMETKSYELLKGWRGDPPKDMDVLVELVVNVAKLLYEHPEIKELDLNPVIAHENGYSIVDARLIRGGPNPGDFGLDHFGWAAVASTPWALQKSAALGAILRPRSIVLVGASEKGRTGAALVESVTKAGFSGEIYLVNRQEESVFGRKCHRSIAEIPGTPDLAVIAVRADRVNEVLGECGNKGIKGVVIISDGFREAGHPELEEQILETAKNYRIGYIGPNCVGVQNMHSGLDAIFISPKRFARSAGKGGIAFVSQSGALGVEILDFLAGSKKMPYGKFISVGNASCVNLTDVLLYLAHDVETTAIALYVEGVPNGKEFMHVLQMACEEKSVVLLKGGMSETTSEAAMSHTGSAIGDVEVFKTALFQAGGIYCTSMRELFGVVRAFDTQPFLEEKKIAVVSNGGGLAVTLTDQLRKRGLELAKLGEGTKEGAKAFLPRHGKISNPLDVLGDAGAGRLIKSADVFLDDENVKGLVVAPVLQAPAIDLDGIADGIIGLAGKARSLGKPLLVYFVGSEENQQYKDFVAKLEQNGVPVYTVEEMMAKAMLSLYHRGEYLSWLSGRTERMRVKRSEWVHGLTIPTGALPRKLRKKALLQNDIDRAMFFSRMFGAAEKE